MMYLFWLPIASWFEYVFLCSSVVCVVPKVGPQFNSSKEFIGFLG